jgi:ligand-binding sensor domain-containing protein/signal transduction histidine kinase
MDEVPSGRVCVIATDLKSPPSKGVGFFSRRRVLGGLFSCLIPLIFCQAIMAGKVAEFNAPLWQTEEGLPNNHVLSITQSRDGYLWVGTREGLVRFDGIKFTPLKISAGTPQPAVTALCAADNGALWIGTAQSGLFRLQDGLLTHHGTGSLMKMPVTQIKQSSNGIVWIVSQGGLASWENGDVHFPVDPEITTNGLLSLFAGHDGGIWIGAARGVQHWGEAGLQTYKVENNVVLRAIRGLFEEEDGTLWIGGNRGLARLKDGVFTHYSKGNGPPGIVTSLLRDRAGNLWVGTQGGLSRFVDGNFYENQEPGGASYGIHTLFEDREGNVWVGSEAGLARLTPKPFVTYAKQAGLTQNATTSVCAGRDGSIWIGTEGGGLDRLKDEKVSTYARSNGLSSDFVVAIMEARDSTLWVGTAYATGSATTNYTPGLNRIRAGQISDDKLVAVSIGSVISSCLEDRAGNVWIGSHNGLFRISPGETPPSPVLIGLSNRAVNALCESRDGSLWIGTDIGLRRWNGQRMEQPVTQGKNFKSAVLALHEDSEGVLWIGMLREGVGRLANGNLTTFSAQQGLVSDSIYAIMEDERHNLWFNGAKGIFRAEKNQFAELTRGAIASLNFVSYGKADGVLGNGQTLDVMQPAACRDAQGHLWFRTTQGVVAIDPNNIGRNELPPPVAIETIIADRKPVSPSNFAPRPFTLRLPPGNGELEIQYTALSLRAPEKNRFKYKLAGADMDWVDAGGRRSAYYNRLAPGTYSFQVIACNDEGVWNETGATLGLVLRPHIWQTWWFYGSTGLLAASIIGIETRHATRRRMQRKLELLKHQHAIEKERARIARDMHDELGAKLTRISFQGATALRSLDDRSEAERQVGSMAETARELVASLDEIVWAVDPGNDSLENLANYICRYASDLCADSPLNCDFVIPTKLPDCRLATDVRHNIFLSVKEALNNALKHSGGTQVQISLSARADQFEVIIMDNGCGFTPSAAGEAPLDKTRRAGHGLINLRDRLAAINGLCELESKPGKGTRVRFVVPLNSAPT